MRRALPMTSTAWSRACVQSNLNYNNCRNVPFVYERIGWELQSCCICVRHHDVQSPSAEAVGNPPMIIVHDWSSEIRASSFGALPSVDLLDWGWADKLMASSFIWCSTRLILSRAWLSITWLLEPLLLATFSSRHDKRVSWVANLLCTSLWKLDNCCDKSSCDFWMGAIFLSSS